MRTISNKKSLAGHLGGLARIKKCGNPGTKEGRRLGGLRSMETHRLRPSGFITLKKIKILRKNIELAELMGIMFGDGHLTNYQASFTTNSDTDYEHALYVSSLFRRLFSIEATMKKRKNQRAVDVIVSSTTLAKYLNKLGMPIGNKLESGLYIPNWIRGKDSFSKAFLRGIFDTDGCVFIDKHKYKNKVYSHLGWAFTSLSGEFLEEVKVLLEIFGFRPTRTDKQNSVYLRRQSDVRRYFDFIGTSNSKHRNRFLRL
jgi:hypothetical protein